MPLNKSELQALNQTNFPDNTQQLITPELLRDFNDDMIASMQLTQSMDNYANLGTANIFYGGNQSIAKEYKLFTNGVYWNNNTAGYNNLEIINSITGNIDIAALGGGVRIVSSSLNITNGTFTASLAEGFTYVGNGSGRTSLVSTSSFGSSINTGSFSTTSSFNAYTQSTNIRLNNLESTSASVNISISNLNSTTSSFATSITNLNTATASLFSSASLGLVTASFSGNTLTFTKGDKSTFGVVIPDVSGSTLPAGTVSSSAQILNYNIFATTGSNTFTGSQFITGGVQIKEYIQTGPNQLSLEAEYAIKTNGALFGNGFTLSGSQATEALNIFYTGTRWQHAGSVIFTNQVSYPVSGAAYAGSGSIEIIAYGGGTLTLSGSQLTLSDVEFIPFSASLNARILTASIDTSSFATLGSNTFTGKQTSPAQTLKDNSNNQFTIIPASSSMMLVCNGFTTASAHLSASNDFSMNLIFKGNNNTGDTIISGSSNIFSNPQTPTTGYKRYIGGNNNLYLNGSNGINSQITASAVSVSGNRPTMINNIFNGDTDFLINQAVNSVGTHTYSHNRIGGTNATVTINALSHTGSVNILTNTVSNGVITINASSASLAEIATGRSGSGNVNVNSNLIQGGTITNTSPLTLGTSLTQTILSNIVTGGSITVTNISSSAAVTSNNNIAIGAMSYTNAGAAGLALHRTAGSFSTCYGAMTFVASGSAITATNNISPAAMTVTNRMFSGSLGSGSLAFNNNQTQGGNNTYTITGSFGGTGNPAMQANGVFGAINTIFTNVEGRGNYVSVSNNLIGGGNLILTGSNNLVLTEGGGAHFGRYNANDGRRNTTGENILSVGTGNATTRKTGLLIDSGSNMFVEGTLSVSGSTAFTGSVKVASTFQLNLATGSNQQVGTAVLDNASPSTVVVSNTLVTADSTIMLTKQTLTNSHMVAVSSKGAGTFTITSNGNGDTDTVAWFIINNS